VALFFLAMSLAFPDEQGNLSGYPSDSDEATFNGWSCAANWRRFSAYCQQCSRFVPYYQGLGH